MKFYTHSSKSSQSVGQKKSRLGFTLVELLVVIAIIGTLGSVSYGLVGKFMEKGRKTESYLLVASVVEASEDFKLEYGFYPKSKAEAADTFFPLDSTELIFVQALTGDSDDQNRSKKSFLKTKVAKKNLKNGLKVDTEGKATAVLDSWGKSIHVAIDYDFKSSGMELDVDGLTIRLQKSVVAISAGADGVINTKDDIRSWGKP